MEQLRKDVLRLAKIAEVALPAPEDVSAMDEFCRQYWKASDVRITILGRMVE